MGEPYAPRGLVADDRELGLTTSRVDTELGSVAVRHSPHRTSSIATLLLHGAAGSWTTWTPMLATAVAEDIPSAILSPSICRAGATRPARTSGLA